MADLSLAEFSDAVGQSFEVEADGATHELRLLEASALPQSGREGGSFRLEFRGSADVVLPQAIYSFRRGERTDEIFIVPVSRNTEGTNYEAIFF